MNTQDGKQTTSEQVDAHPGWKQTTSEQVDAHPGWETNNK